MWYARTVIHKFRANDDATARTCATARGCWIQPRCTDVELVLALGCGTWEFDFMVKPLGRALHRCGLQWLPQRQISNALVPQTRNCLRHARGRDVEPRGIPRIGTWGQTFWGRQRDHAREHCTLQRQHAIHTLCHICVTACTANACHTVSHSAKLPPGCARALARATP